MGKGHDVTTEFTVTYTRTVAVSVSADYVPQGFTLPWYTKDLPPELLAAITEALPEHAEDIIAVQDENGIAAYRTTS